MEKQELDALLAELSAQLRELGIPLGKHIAPQVEVNTRAQRRLGCCVCREGRFTIQVSARLLEDAPLLRATLLHELLHTCYGCQNHGKRWKAYAQRVDSVKRFERGLTDNGYLVLKFFFHING